MKRPLSAGGALLLLLAGGGGGSGGGALGFVPPAAPPSRSVGLAPWGIGHGPGRGGRGESGSTPTGRVAPFYASSLEEPASPSSSSSSSSSSRRRRRWEDERERGGGKVQQAQQRQQRRPKEQAEHGPSSFRNLPAAPEAPKKPMLTNLVSWLASKLIRRRAKKVSGLDIDVGARSNGDVLAGNLPRVQAKFDRIVLESLQISGGGQMEITGLNVRVLGLLLARRLNVIRRPFEIFGQYVLTQQDVSASKLIRDLIQLLVNTVLRTLFPSLHLTFFDVAIDEVRIRDQKLAIMGTASIAELSEDGMPFTLLTGVGLAGDGHIVYLDNPELVLNPQAPLPVKVPLGSIRAFDVDIGDNARIERIEIDDKLGVSITARTLITPAPPFLVTDVGKRAAFLYDVGAFFSSFFGFVNFQDLGVE